MVSFVGLSLCHLTRKPEAGTFHPGRRPNMGSWRKAFALSIRTGGSMFLLRLRRLLSTAGRDLVVLWFAFRHPATSIGFKLMTFLLGLYILSPIDFLPDTIPILGWMDDVTLLAFGIPALLKLAPVAALHDAHGAADSLLSRWAIWRNRGQ
jgi:uncharacterized membrane protein YkvA (DUF1232 family)